MLPKAKAVKGGQSMVGHIKLSNLIKKIRQQYRETGFTFKTFGKKGINIIKMENRVNKKLKRQ